MCMVRFMKILAIAPGTAFALLLGATVGANASPYIVTLEQDGTSVVATGSGAIDTTGLTLNNTFLSFDPEVVPDRPIILIGPSTLAELYQGPITGASEFGTGGYDPADTGTGSATGITEYPGSIFYLSVPDGYTSDTPLSNTATWTVSTLAGLGLTSGTYVWTWGSDPDQSFTLEIGTIGTTPLPAALPLFATGLGAFGLFGWRRKRKNAAAIATA
jgi:hypothetical protein